MLTKKQEEIIYNMQSSLKEAPWILRVTERKDFTGPMLEICERQYTDSGKTRLKEYGRIYNGTLRTCRPAIRYMLSQELDSMGRSAGLHELIDEKTEYRGQIPLRDEIGAKLALLFKLHPQVRSQERIELMAWRIERFTREEALYWVGKVSIPVYGKRGIEWAKSGLRLMLAGQQKDEEAVRELLEKLRKGGTANGL